MHCQEVLKISPDDADAHFNWALTLTRRGRLDEAIVHYRKGLETKPGDARAHCFLGAALARRGRFGGSIAQFEQAVDLKPDDVDAQTNLAWLRATCPEASLRDGAAAIAHAQVAMQLCSGRRADVFDALAAAYAEAGRFPEALAAARKALELAVHRTHPPWLMPCEAGLPYTKPASLCTRSCRLRPCPLRPWFAAATLPFFLLSPCLTSARSDDNLQSLRVGDRPMGDDASPRPVMGD